jgi:hypothetical protein
MSTSKHAQTDGQTERANRTIEEILRAYISPLHDDWDLHLTAAEFAYKDSVQASTGYSPFYLNYGQHPTTPLVLLRGEKPKSRDTSVDAFVSRMQANLDSARAAIKTAQERQVTQANKHRRHHEFHVGDSVYLSADHFKPLQGIDTRKKFRARAYGPYRIKRVLSSVTYELDLPPNIKIHPVVHISQLRECHQSTEFAERTQIYSPPPPQVIDGEEFFTIDYFVDERGSGARKEYLVHWAGYGHDRDEWQLAMKLRSGMHKRGYDELVNRFEQRKAEIAVRRSRTTSLRR